LRRPRRVLRVAALLLIAVGCHYPYGDGRACAGESDILSVHLPDGKHTITFRRLPKVADANPYASPKVEAETKPYELPSVYLAEQELSLRELRALVSDKTWDAYTARVLAYTGTDEDPKFGSYRKAVRAFSDKYPAILVDLGMILEACTALDKLASERPECLSLRAELAAVRFRIPSRVEWQYAARGTQDVAEAKTREVFPKWPQFDTGLKGRWQDLCEKASIDPRRIPSPAVVCEAADSMLANKQSKEGYEFLGEVLKKTLGFEVNIFRTADQNILPVDSGAVDAWGFRRLLGNASEWTLDRTSLEDV
jgi:formylglycine-generating enzyme required for sulfatase activity